MMIGIPLAAVERHLRAWSIRQFDRVQRESKAHGGLGAWMTPQDSWMAKVGEMEGVACVPVFAMINC